MTQRILPVVLFALLLLSGSHAFGQTAQRGYEDRLRQIGGPDTVNCGSFEWAPFEQRLLTDDQYAKALECMSGAWREGKPFLFAFGGVGIDSYVASGVLGLRERRGLYRFSYDSAPCGAPGGCAPAFGLSLCRAMNDAQRFDPEGDCQLNFKPKRPPVPATPPQGPERQECSFPGLALPREFEILAAGAYGGRKTGFQIDQSGHEAMQIDVAVTRTDRPVVLMLGAYEPTIWNLYWAKKTRIAGVVVSGYHRQALAGLDPAVPVLNTSFDNKGACGYFYVTANSLEKLNPFADRLFRRNVDLVYLAKDGKVVIGEPVGADEKLITSDSVRPESYYDPTAPRSGHAGLEDAVAKGLLRRATEADADAWVAAASVRTNVRQLPPIAGQGRPKAPRPSVYGAYVVLKPFVFPAGLYGGNSATFFVPAGVPKPTGNAGHSKVYDFNSIECSGPGCRSE